MAPPSLGHCYSERLALMPHSYFVNDYKQAHMDVLDEANLPSRAEVTAGSDQWVALCARCQA